MPEDEDEESLSPVLILQPDRDLRRPLPIPLGIELEVQLVPADGRPRALVDHRRVHHADRRALPRSPQ
ncbi:MAG: hypothetical protein PHV57_07810 [Methanomicrobiaceae archaeon]|nr:hypothetical protein [Methanomicrobiaceae archaeon]